MTKLSGWRRHCMGGFLLFKYNSQKNLLMLMLLLMKQQDRHPKDK